MSSPSEAVTRPSTVSVVISTYQRPELCERALRSALCQSEPPLEVLVCDDGSHDTTARLFRDWESRDPRVRYLRVEPGRGAPAAARNLGIEAARGTWVAFLDDDDEWLPDKLALQSEHMAAAEVIGGNALGRQSQAPYFVSPPSLARPDRREVRGANPIVFSTAIVRRDWLLAAGGFFVARWARGIEDYILWLELADRGARFVVLGELLVRYDDASVERLSASVAVRQLALARLRWRRAVRDPTQLGPALRQTAVALRWLAVARP